MSILHLYVRVLNCSYFNALNFNKTLDNVPATASVCVCVFYCPTFRVIIWLIYVFFVLLDVPVLGKYWW